MAEAADDVIATTMMSMSAHHWGALWSHRPRAWALSEEQHIPVYAQTLRHIGLKRGARVLDLGCATGVFLRMCADREAIVAGVDASAVLLALARTRLSAADLRVADLQTLPYADDTFDLVTGFRSLFFADDIIAALREARRVARPDAQVVIQVFGRREHCDLEAVKDAAAEIGAAPPPDTHERAHWRPIVEEIAPRAGLTVENSFEITSANTYADETATLDAMLAALPGVAAIAGPAREPELHVAILRALAHRRRPDGGYCIRNRWHTVIARA